MRRIGSRAGFIVVPIGLVFAAFQVQRWTMPRLLAVLLITAMLAIAVVAALSIGWETIKEIRGWRERRETSTAWIEEEPPGRLDLAPDMDRATKKFVRQMGRLSGDTEKVGKQRARDARTLAWASLLGPRAAQLWANHSAKGILRSAVFIEKRTAHLQKTVKEFARAREAHLVGLDAPTTAEDREALENLRKDTAESLASTADAIASVSEYRDSVREFAQINASRTLRVSSERLSEQLDAMVAVLRLTKKDTERFQALLDRMAKP